MSDEVKMHPAWKWLMDNRDQLASILCIFGILTVLVTSITWAVATLPPYNTILITGFWVIIIAGMCALNIYHIIHGYLLSARDQFFATWTVLILWMGFVLIAIYAVSSASFIELEIQVTTDPVKKTITNHIAAYGTLASRVVMFFLLLLVAVRFYWDTHVRLLLLEAFAKTQGCDLTAVRKDFFNSEVWRRHRKLKFSVLRLAGPTDLPYIDDDTPQEPQPTGQ